MSMFKSSEFLDEESIQAIRLDESLDKLIIEGQSDIDSREDPELSELLAVGAVLRSTADDVTSRSSFKSFHMRSRAAILHATGTSDTSFEHAGVIGKLIRAVLPMRGSIISAVSASVATLAVILWINPGGSNGDTSIPVARAPEATASVSVQVVPSSFSGSTTDIPESVIENMSTSLVANESNLVEETRPILVGKESVEAIVIGTNYIFTSMAEGTPISVELLRELTDHLALLGADLRFSEQTSDMTAKGIQYQQAISAAMVALQTIQPEGQDSAASLMVAQVVAADSMHEALEVAQVEHGTLSAYGMMVARLASQVQGGSAISASQLSELLTFSDGISTNLRRHSNSVDLAIFRKYQGDVGSLIQTLESLDLDDEIILTKLRSAESDFVFVTREVLRAELVLRPN
jgi:hypothetical protein